VAAKTKVVSSAPHQDGAWAEWFVRAPGEVRYWLVKSEPEVFSFEQLMKAPKKTTCWDGVRNFAARNFLKDGMKKGDQLFYYHSNANPQAIVGICEVVKEGYPDHTALDRTHDHFDEKSDPADPTWFMVDVKAVAPLKNPVTLAAIKATKSLAEMALIRTGRLSVIPISTTEWKTILKMAE
jgi:predicted RNA-binding protein with PUA-like domain